MKDLHVVPTSIGPMLMRDGAPVHHLKSSEMIELMLAIVTITMMDELGVDETAAERLAIWTLPYCQ